MKKLPAKSRPTTPTTARVLVRLDLDAPTHQEVRLAAAREGVSMAEFARCAVTKAAREINRAAK